jgi:mannose-6-phosphate isomerase-like protein (cupin superfamily)
MNPMGKVHSMKNTGSGEIVFLQVFTPEWKEPDRVFVP